MDSHIYIVNFVNILFVGLILIMCKCASLCLGTGVHGGQTHWAPGTGVIGNCEPFNLESFPRPIMVLLSYLSSPCGYPLSYLNLRIFLVVQLHHFDSLL